MSLVANVQSSTNGQDHSLAQRPSQSSPNQTQLTQEPYYSNQDIAILHSVVSSAQDEFDRSPFPKPLPAAVLFKAYDDVLPTFGIDPDSDHHLSALVFRIGGEHGGSLLDKFEAILKRMGILLEFGENTTTSQHPSHSRSPSVTQDKQDTIELTNALELDASPGKDRNLSSDLVRPRSSTPGRRHLEQPKHVVVTQEAPALAHTTTIHSLHRLPNCEKYVGDAPPVITAKDLVNSSSTNSNGLKVANTSRIGLAPVKDHWPTIASIGAGHDHALNTTFPATFHEKPKDNLPFNNAQSPTSALLENGKTPEIHSRLDTNQSDLDTLENQFLGNRAARARQIFLASKVFNKWADETAVRLEREAIARRHMVRFRCFNSWTLAPDSRVPMVRHLKAVTAVQKLRRAVKCHEEQLNVASLLIHRSYIHKKAERFLGYWRTCVLARQAFKMSDRRIKNCVVGHWLNQATTDNRFASKVVGKSNYHKGSHLCAKWMRRAKSHVAQIDAARQISAASGVMAWLHEWRDQCEANFRARTCRRLLATENSLRVFEVWNLRARAQAFRWKCEYFSILELMNMWSTAAKLDSVQETASKKYYTNRTISMLISHMRSHSQDQRELSYLGRRARWYIQATRLVQVFDSTARYHKHQSRLVIRRYLMMRYTQVSSRRRQRSFYAALGRWHSHATQMLDLVRAGHDYQMKHDVGCKLAAATSWEQHRLQAETLLSLAVDYHKEHMLDKWRYEALTDERRQTEALGLRSTERQRQSLKDWTISALQRSGQAHSAITVRQRHNRENRNRALLSWRRLASPAKADLPELQSPAWNGPLHSSRRVMKSLSRPRPVFRQFEDGQDLMSPLKTPSRSTGLSLTATRTLPLRLMDPVEEVDGKSVNQGQNNMANLWNHDDPRRSRMADPGTISSTTPRAPMPKDTPWTMRYASASAGHWGHASSLGLVGARRIRENGDRFDEISFTGRVSKPLVSGQHKQTIGERNAIEANLSTTPLSRPQLAKPSR
ncbi:Sfi1 domain spindle body protein [Metarhizium robertsii]|uniref:Sfi1 domain spindle body protein n=1 Tax=Metarhizium robertsii TaxID=568076 RepID=A0A014PSP6_9HYPO|nr:Sfi1 domain spindle body protein [Metarhizium robertsii]